MQCKVHPLGSLKDYKYVLILSCHEGKFVLSQHRDRTTWETQGGHIEPGETPMEAARRELYEESGAQVYTLTPIFDYWAGDDEGGANAMVFEADVEKFGPIPPMEMARIGLFEELPKNLTYPDICSALFAHQAALDRKDAGRG